MVDARAAALALIAARTDINFATTIDDASKVAAMMLAARLYKRRTSPEGVAGFGELGVVTIKAIDPDVEALIASHLTIDGFA